MEINTATATPATNSTKLAARPENTNNPNQAPQNQGTTPNTSDTVNISSAATARLEAADNDTDDRGARISPEQAQQTVQTIQQSNPPDLLRAQGAPSSTQQIRSLLG